MFHKNPSRHTHFLHRNNPFFRVGAALILGAISLTASIRAEDAAAPTASSTPAKKSKHADTTSTDQRTITERSLVVRGEEVPSAYGAPPALSRSRFSNLVNAYVLPPWAVFAAAIYEGDALRYNRP